MNLNTIHEAPNAWGLSPIDEYSPLVEQGYQNSCAVRCQQLILNDFGFNVTEDQLVNVAINHGWYGHESGTQMDHVGNLLEYYGVSVNTVQNANIFSLTSELAQGRRVIVGIDSGELWKPDWGEGLSDLFGDAPDHAVIVAGIDTSDPDNVTVQLMDPGTGQIAASYPLNQFLDAWQDSNCFMVSTTEPAPPYAYGMNNFDYTTMHVPYVGDMPYPEYDRLVNYNDFSQWDGHDYGSWSPESHNSYGDGFLGCIKGETKISEMLGNVFGDNIPNPDDMTRPEPIPGSIVIVDPPIEISSDWDTYNQYMADIYSSNGDELKADWYQRQGMDEPDDVPAF